jgi:hypothetical protein
MNKNIYILLCCLLVSITTTSMAQNKAKGFFASYHYSTLPNTDDLKAGSKLDYATTFKFGGGVDYLNYLSNNFGIGTQFSFYQAGQNYTGLYDSINNITMKASTSLNYLKSAFLVHYRSYNRYNPQQRFRAECFLGPYVALLPAFEDRIELFNASNVSQGGIVFNTIGRRPLSGSIGQIDTKSPIYKFFDYGLVVSPGMQYMLTPKFAIALNVRADISAVNIEATGNIGQKIQNPINPSQEEYIYWDNLIYKYYFAPSAKDKYDQRPSTKNLLIGTVLTLRWYNDPQYYK